MSPRFRPVDVAIEVALDPQHGRIARVAKRFWPMLNHREERALDRAAREVLGIPAKTGLAYRHTSVHSNFQTGKAHPDNNDALATISRGDIAPLHRRGGVIVEQRVPSSLQESVVLIGSPTAEAISRFVFGYEPVEGAEDGLSYARPTLDLRWRWQLDPESISERARAKRFVRGSGEAWRPNWRIVDEWTGEEHIPTLNDGWLVSDYLLVTRLRNFLTRDAHDEGKSIVSIGGAHGTGTRAIELLLADRPALRKMREELGGRTPLAYQALFAVSDLRHRAREGTRARRIDFVAAQKLEDTPERWRTAAEIVSPGMHAWASRDSGEDTPSLL